MNKQLFYLLLSIVCTTNQFSLYGSATPVQEPAASVAPAANADEKVKAEQEMDKADHTTLEDSQRFARFMDQYAGAVVTQKGFTYEKHARSSFSGELGLKDKREYFVSLINGIKKFIEITPGAEPKAKLNAEELEDVFQKRFADHFVMLNPQLFTDGRQKNKRLLQALKNIAAAGLEDFENYDDDEYANIFKELNEVILECATPKGGASSAGYQADLKKLANDKNCIVIDRNSFYAKRADGTRTINNAEREMLDAIQRLAQEPVTPTSGGGAGDADANDAVKAQLQRNKDRFEPLIACVQKHYSWKGHLLTATFAGAAAVGATYAALKFSGYQISKV